MDSHNIAGHDFKGPACSFSLSSLLWESLEMFDKGVHVTMAAPPPVSSSVLEVGYTCSLPYQAGNLSKGVAIFTATAIYVLYIKVILYG